MIPGVPVEASATSLAAIRRRGRSIAAVGVFLVLAIAIQRQAIAPGVRPPFGAQFLEGPGASGSVLRPAVMFLSLVTELVALTALSRTLERRRVSVSTIALATVGLGIAVMLAFGLVQWVVNGAHRSGLARVFFGSPLGGLEVFGLWVLAFRYRQLVDDARLRALEMERTRQAAEISQLREHLQPHFLRNSLNAIAALVRKTRPRRAICWGRWVICSPIRSTTPLRFAHSGKSSRGSAATPKSWKRDTAARCASTGTRGP